MEPVIGIDLGTTNSEVAFVFDGHVNIIERNGSGIVPSCVGLTDEGNIIVGNEARNQAVVAPDRTVSSIKRKMGQEEKVYLGNSEFSPQEVSAFILKYLKEASEQKIGRPIRKAVITVPAYFTDAQRQATREAGEIAGLQVVRIVNEPTAAALAYENDNPETQQILVYDLGGGTFDVSIVRIEDGVVEVLSSTGDNHLGGDDFDQRLINHMVRHLETEEKIEIKTDPKILARLKRAAETAKIALSDAPFATIEEDHICKTAHQDIHLSMEISRFDFEQMIEADLTRTMESVNKALKDARMLPSAIDKIILVGGSTKIPLVSQMLEKKFNKQPIGHIDPDLCVALGAGIQAAREMGINNSGVLVDITPYTFGTSAIGEIDGTPSMTMFYPLIRRNTKLPAKKSDAFLTVVDNQEAVDVRVYQGEHPDAEDNVLLGNYIFNLTKAPAGSEIIMVFDLDLNGILKIHAVEKESGKSINATIENAISRFSNQELLETQNRINGLWAQSHQEVESDSSVATPVPASIPPHYSEVIEKARQIMIDASEDDREDIVNAIEDLQEALKENRLSDAEQLKNDLDDILFYLEI